MQNFILQNVVRDAEHQASLAQRWHVHVYIGKVGPFKKNVLYLYNIYFSFHISYPIEVNDTIAKWDIQTMVGQ